MKYFCTPTSTVHYAVVTKVWTSVTLLSTTTNLVVITVQATDLSLAASSRFFDASSFCY